MKKQPRWSCLLLGVALAALALTADIQNKGPAQHLLYRSEQLEWAARFLKYPMPQACPETAWACTAIPHNAGYPRHQPTGLINGAARTSLFQPAPELSITLPLN